MSFAEKFLKSLTDLFLVLHRIAIPCAVVTPILMWLYPINYVAFLLIVFFLFFAPVGPLSLEVFDLAVAFINSCLSISSLTDPPAYLLLVLGVVVGIVILKSFIYLAIRRNIMFGVSATWILAACSAAVSLTLFSEILAISPSLHLWLSLWGMLKVLTIILVFTVPMDLVVFSYVKFRDAVRGVESEKWLPVLAALWTAMLWPMPAVIILHWVGLPDFWNPFTVILISTRAAITVVQLSYIVLFVRSGDAVLLKRMTGEPGSSNPASCA